MTTLVPAARCFCASNARTRCATGGASLSALAMLMLFALMPAILSRWPHGAVR